MDILTSIPVRMYGPASIPGLLEDVKERIALRAYENFLDRGGDHGHDLDDWFNAERELIIKADPTLTVQGEDVFIEMTLPETDFHNVAVHISPSQFVVSSDENEDGRQLCQVIDLPFEIFEGSVDAEQLDNSLRITAAVFQHQLR